MISPVGPVSEPYVVTERTARALLAHWRTAILLQYTDGFRPEVRSGQWYAVICRSFVDLGQYNAKKRSQIRKALRECTVRKTDAEFVAKHGYEVFASAYSRYTRGRRQLASTKEQFARAALVAADFGDIIEYWAVFHQDTLVGYAQNYLFGRTEASYSLMAFDPAYFRFYSSYALIYRMNEYYLGEKGFQYTNDGFRTLLHQTELQHLLVGKFGFERAYCNLHIHYRPYIAWIMSSPALVRGLLSQMSSRFAALNALHEARTDLGE
jgi:hypothetical protein